MNAVLFEVSTVRIATGDRNITYNNQTYTADGSLLSIEGPTGGDLPGYTFSVRCDPGSAQRTLFSASTGPEEVNLTLVEATFADSNGALSWTKIWSYSGILDRGSLVDNIYRGQIQHAIEHHLYALPRRYWNSKDQRARVNNSQDEGADHVATLSPSILSAWPGINA